MAASDATVHEIEGAAKKCRRAGLESCRSFDCTTVTLFSKLNTFRPHDAKVLRQPCARKCGQDGLAAQRFKGVPILPPPGYPGFSAGGSPRG